MKYKVGDVVLYQTQHICLRCIISGISGDDTPSSARYMNVKVIEILKHRLKDYDVEVGDTYIFNMHNTTANNISLDINYIIDQLLEVGNEA